MFNVGAQLRKTRKKANLTLDQLAASSGVDRGTISRIELGHVSPRLDTIASLCEAMNTTVGTFFEASDLPEEGEEAARSPQPPAPEPLPGEEPPLDRMAQRPESPFPMGAPGAPMEGYWPVPTSFWRGLLEVLERFEVLVKNSREMIMVQDQQGIILYLSPPCEQLLGYRPQELVGQRVATLIHPEDQEAYGSVLTGLSGQPGGSRNLDYRMLHKDATWRHISSRFTNQLENPSIRAVVVNSLELPAARESSHPE